MEWNTFRLPGAVAGFHTPCCGVGRAERRDALGRPDKWGNSRPLVPVDSLGMLTTINLALTPGGRRLQHHLLLSYLHLAVEVSRGINDFLQKNFSLISSVNWIGRIMFIEILDKFFNTNS